ncbi:hypothetical protein JJC00_09090 [Bradyrhizobium diazoefficiens]|uniref:hypothetical protein n=1 Tax=Bradyrhizobium diazoefficiens TaxID=1355477 RepID=UPI00190AE166|nr:hypothetical protein [Bradyrhizobium diazoefficiens]QQO35707.1 hypothetical protein JJC00_09090 [Bradyrhizobium diazoefficiens]
MLTLLRLLLLDEKLRRPFCPFTFELYRTTSIRTNQVCNHEAGAVLLSARW